MVPSASFHFSSLKNSRRAAAYWVATTPRQRVRARSVCPVRAYVCVSKGISRLDSGALRLVTYKHMYIHASIQPSIHGYVHAHIHAHIHACIHTYKKSVYTKVYILVNTCIHANVHTYVYVYKFVGYLIWGLVIEAVFA